MQTDQYLVRLDFRPEDVGVSSMTLQLAVDPARGALSGRAEGTIREGKVQGPRFSADASGNVYSTGLTSATKVAGVEGQAIVCFPPPDIRFYLTSFKASFVIDDDWKGVGTFSVGKDSYDCHLSKTEC
ncbi:hypothetical protein ThidrDRAFT_3411 [Thiorhodococcus drewsii AZ1]|uniref:DUF1842 domain-containing protein n=1 Tax=Thiorhodococcus drewsii AZ1 TaxID=765913 RepID=G2E548_9GAMM|nr:hypothetical protein ThidrDRAFT_3411 [Thiorhodococcus drewsii AZ1]